MVAEGVGIGGIPLHAEGRGGRVQRDELILTLGTKKLQEILAQKAEGLVLPRVSATGGSHDGFRFPFASERPK